MFRSIRKWRERRAIAKVKPGDGHSLKHYRFYQLLSSSLFYTRVKDKDGNLYTYAVDIHNFSEESEALLYQDGKHVATSKLPAIFPIVGGIIEVDDTTYGVKRMHYVTNEEEEIQLYPDSISAEGLRMRLDRRFPKLSKGIGVAAIIILLSSIVLGLPQLIGLLFEIPIIQETLGTFESPFTLPAWLNTFLLIPGVLATTERALTLRSHWH